MKKTSMKMTNTSMIGKMSMSTMNTSLSEKLARQVGIVYRSSSLICKKRLPPKEVCHIMHSVNDGTYLLSSRKLVFLKENELDDHKEDIPSLMKVGENLYAGIYIKESDRLVLIALGELLVQEYGDSEHLHSSICCHTSEEYINKVLGWGMVDNLLICDLSNAAPRLSREPLKMLVSAIVKDQVIRNLVLSFIDLPIEIRDGEYAPLKFGIGSVSVLTEFLVELYYTNVEKRIEISNPSLYGARYNSELIIPVLSGQKQEPNVLFHLEHNLLSGWNTRVRVMGLVPGCEMVEFSEGLIMITVEKVINIYPRQKKG